MHRSFFIMSIFHLGELVFNVRKIKSARDYALAISWQSQPLVLNHLIIVFGGFLIFAQEIIGFSAYIIFLALYAIRFLNIFGFFLLKVKTKFVEIESMEKMRTESVEGLMQKVPLIERELVVDYTPIDFWNRPQGQLVMKEKTIFSYEHIWEPAKFYPGHQPKDSSYAETENEAIAKFKENQRLAFKNT